MCKVNTAAANAKETIANRLGLPVRDLRLVDQISRKMVKLGPDAGHVIDFGKDEYLLDIPQPDADFFVYGMQVEIIKVDVSVTPISSNQPDGGQSYRPRFPFIDNAYFSGAGEADALNKVFNSFGKFTYGTTQHKMQFNFRDFLKVPVSPFIPAASSGTGADVWPVFDGQSAECVPLKSVIEFKAGVSHKIDLSILGGSNAAIQGLANEVAAGTCNYLLVTLCGCCRASDDLCTI